MRYRIFLPSAVLSAALFLASCGSAPAPSASAAAASAPAAEAAAPAGTAGEKPGPTGPDVSGHLGPSGPSEGGITVNASAAVTLTPDRASVSLGVTTRGATAEEVQSGNAAGVNRVLEVLKADGIAESGIKTSDFRLRPEHDYSDGRDTITGYSASTTLTVSDLEISSVGKIISDCVNAGADQADDIRYYCSGYDAAYEEALAKAVEAAHAKADALAKAAGRELGQAVTINEGWQDTSARYAKAASNDAVSLASVSENSMDVMPGETEIKAEVTVIYGFH